METLACSLCCHRISCSPKLLFLNKHLLVDMQGSALIALDQRVQSKVMGDQQNTVINLWGSYLLWASTHPTGEGWGRNILPADHQKPKFGFQSFPLPRITNTYIYLGIQDNKLNLFLMVTFPVLLPWFSISKQHKNSYELATEFSYMKVSEVNRLNRQKNITCTLSVTIMCF